MLKDGVEHCTLGHAFVLLGHACWERMLPAGGTVGVLVVCPGADARSPPVGWSSPGLVIRHGSRMQTQCECWER